MVRPDLVARQATALAAHGTQVRVFDGYYALSNDVAARLAGREGFAPVDPRTGRPHGPGASGPAGGPRGHDSHDGLDSQDAPVRLGLLGEAGPWA